MSYDSVSAEELAKVKQELADMRELYELLMRRVGDIETKLSESV